MLDIEFIPYNCGSGAADDRCSAAPLFLKESKLLDHISQNWAKFYNIATYDSLSKLDQIVEINKFISSNIINSLERKKFPIILGGDHSCAIGSWGSIVKYFDAICNFGLIWVDAHMDSHTEKTSASGNYHGMPLAVLLGYGNNKLVNLNSIGAKINPKNICLIGVRDYEEEEKKFLENLGVKIFYISDVNNFNIEKIILQSLDIVSKNTKAFGLSIDIDAFDPKIAPGTGYRVQNGLQENFLHAINLISKNKKLKAVEIAEFNPALDLDNKTAILIKNILSDMIIS